MMEIKKFKYDNPNEARSMTQWARDFVNNNPHATLIDYEGIMSAHGRRSGRSQYYQACREYRDKHGLGKLPRGGDGKPKPANHGQRLPARKKVEAVSVKGEAAPAKKDNGFPPTLDALRRSGPQEEIREVTMKLLLWMQKYNVRVINIECESQEVTMSNPPAIARQRVPSPHFTVNGE
jgi:hypothetical protein